MNYFSVQSTNNKWNQPNEVVKAEIRNIENIQQIIEMMSAYFNQNHFNGKINSFQTNKKMLMENSIAFSHNKQ